ncbi:patatin-like phospholipase family protein [Geitlerinema splendidum]|nr:patatin-like phospholipase family protein [Geitlerinema splendidum]
MLKTIFMVFYIIFNKIKQSEMKKTSVSTLIFFLLWGGLTNFVSPLNAGNNSEDDGNIASSLMRSPQWQNAPDNNPIIHDDNFPSSVAANKKHVPSPNPESSASSENPALVLALDGGGMRGLAPILILSSLEKDISEKLGQPIPISKIFDSFAGSSIGGLTALLVASGRPINNCDELFETEGPKIFSRYFYQKFTNPWGAIWPLYNVQQGLEPVLAETFKEEDLKEALKPVFVTTYAPELGRLLLLDSEHAKNPNKGYSNLKMRKAARFTSAAPTYFRAGTFYTQRNIPIEKDGKTEEVPFINLPGHKVIDGGVAANDPTLLAYSRAKELFPNRSIFVLSLGTGHAPYPKINGNEGLFSFVPLLANIFLDGTTAATGESLRMLLKDDYCRLQFESTVELDDASPEALTTLKQEAEQIIKTDPYKHLVERLTSILRKRK